MNATKCYKCGREVPSGRVVIGQKDPNDKDYGREGGRSIFNYYCLKCQYYNSTENKTTEIKSPEKPVETEKPIEVEKPTETEKVVENKDDKSEIKDEKTEVNSETNGIKNDEPKVEPKIEDKKIENEAGKSETDKGGNDA
jgi:hypothetical protein